MYKRLSIALTAALLFSLITPVSAQVSPVKRLKAFLASTKSLEANFRQVLIDERGNPGKSSTGIFYLAKPGRFRWDYQHPYQQEIVSDGNKVWFYDVDLEQVTVKKLGKALGSTPAMLLSGELSLDANFIIEKEGESEGMQWVRLKPKEKNSSFNYMIIGLDGGTIGGMELNDNFGQTTRIYFSDTKINGTVDEKQFRFVPPKGVDLFEE